MLLTVPKHMQLSSHAASKKTDKKCSTIADASSEADLSTLVDLITTAGPLETVMILKLADRACN
jgi:hypothetical protein